MRRKYQKYQLIEAGQAAPNIPARQPTLMSTSQTGYSGTAKAKAARSPYTSPSLDSVPEVEFTIPPNGNISSFTTDQMANFLRCLNVEDRIISHLHRKSVDGKRFSRMRNSELDSLGMNNPVVLFFRDKSTSSGGIKKMNKFVL